MKSHRAFTIVEILIIISVITILAGIASLGYSGMQRDARNKERESDIAIIQTALEQFYEKNGYYPPMDKMSGGGQHATEVTTAEAVTFLTRDLNIPSTALIAPNAPEGTKSSISTYIANLFDGSANKTYIYMAIMKPDDGTDNPQECVSADLQCSAYGLSYYTEGEDESTAWKTVESKYGR